jgi:DNA-binding transcriptional ArsR family regulator
MNTRKQARPAQGSPIAEPRQIRALASPMRQDIMDAVKAIGPCTVAELAAMLGKPADGLYYHLKPLLDVRLLAEVRGDGNGRSDLRIDVAHPDFFLEYQPANRTNKAAILRVIGAMVRSAERMFHRAFRPDAAVVTGPKRNLWASRSRGSLSAAELVELNALLGQVNALRQAGRRDAGSDDGEERSLYELTYVLAPVVNR